MVGYARSDIGIGDHIKGWNQDTLLQMGTVTDVYRSSKKQIHGEAHKEISMKHALFYIPSDIPAFVVLYVYVFQLSTSRSRRLGGLAPVRSTPPLLPRPHHPPPLVALISRLILYNGIDRNGSNFMHRMGVT